MVTKYIFRFTQISINVIYIQTSTSDPQSVHRIKLCMPSYGTAELPGRCTEELLQKIHGDWPGKEALTIALADGSLLVAEKPVWVVTEGAPPIPVRRERRSRRAAMVTHSQWTNKPSMNSVLASWMPKQWRQQPWLSTEDRKRLQPRGHWQNGIFKKMRAVRDK